MASNGASWDCRFGEACTREDCIYDHPLGRILFGAHNPRPLCQYGLSCKTKDCRYSHPSAQPRGQKRAREDDGKQPQGDKRRKGGDSDSDSESEDSAGEATASGSRVVQHADFAKIRRFIVSQLSSGGVLAKTIGKRAKKSKEIGRSLPRSVVNHHLQALRAEGKATMSATDSYGRSRWIRR